jgi:hypothetical protein
MKHQEVTGTVSLHRMFYCILCACNSGWDIAHNSLNYQLGWYTCYFTNLVFKLFQSPSLIIASKK